MMLIEETTVPTAALPVALFKEHLRLGSGFADDGVQDGLLEGFLRSALAAIEARTGKALIERTFSWSVTRWRAADEQALPIAPVSAIVEVVLVDRVGGETVVDNMAYRLRPDMQRPVLLASGSNLPRVPHAGSVRIGMMAGFGPEWSDLPADLTQAVFLLAAHYYEYRHEIQYDGGCMPFGVSALIERYRTLRLMGGGRVMGYRLNRKLVLETPAQLPDGAGGFTENWTALGTLWADIIARTGREAAGVAAPISRVAYKIIVRAAPTTSGARPHPNQRFREGARLYRILAVAEDDSDGRYLMCTAQEETVA